MRLIPPHGRSPQDKIKEDTIQQSRPPIAPSRLSGAAHDDPAIFPAAVPGAGTAAAGFLGFALGLSELGGEDWLLPTTAPRVVGRSFTPELN
jgi:hypothetical protein